MRRSDNFRGGLSTIGSLCQLSILSPFPSMEQDAKPPLSHARNVPANLLKSIPEAPLTRMDAKTYYEWYNREDPFSPYHPEKETTFSLRLDWFIRNIPPQSKILDYGCGEGVALAGLSEKGNIHTDSCGVDIAENAVKKASTRFPELKFLQTNPDGTTSFADESFDAIVASEVIEHIFDTDGVFKEFRRLLRPSGRLLLSCPYHGFLKDLAILLAGKMDAHYHDPYSQHIRYYSRVTLRLIHERHGFHLIKQSGVGRIPFLWNSMVTLAIKLA